MCFTSELANVTMESINEYRMQRPRIYPTQYSVHRSIRVYSFYSPMHGIQFYGQPAQGWNTPMNIKCDIHSVPPAESGLPGSTSTVSQHENGINQQIWNAIFTAISMRISMQFQSIDSCAHMFRYTPILLTNKPPPAESYCKIYPILSYPIHYLGFHSPIESLLNHFHRIGVSCDDF